jgi:Cu(I)/Ag(I) efflux system membrane protein CusA/SilA
VETIDAGSGVASISHGPVASLKWPPMTMAFKVANESLLKDLKPGAAISFEFVERAAGRVGDHLGQAGGKPSRRKSAGLRRPTRTPVTDRPLRTLTEIRRHAGEIIDWSGRNRFLVLLATLFVTIGGIYAVLRTPIDALPDLSDVQVIVYTEYPGQAPQVVEDQVTYPLTTAMLSVPKSRVVRGFSFFGASFVYIIFEDGTDIYWARSRVLEYLNFASSRMPRGVTPSLGPDATGVGWVYQYALLAKDKTLAELRTIQDWYVRYQLSKAHGVAEVASIGGFVQTYQVTVDPVKLRAYGIPLMKVAQVIRDSNRDVGGRVVEMAETEYMVRGKGYLRGKSDIEMLVVKSEKGTPVLIRDIARVELVPDERRGLTELNGEGEVVSGIAMARYGQNALEVIHNLKARIAEIGPGLPGRGDGGNRLRPLRTDPPRHRNPEANAARGIDHRRAGVHRFPAARAQRAGRHPDAAGRHPHRLHRHAPARHELQPDEPGRHRHRHRRDDRRGDRDDRERPQTPGTSARGAFPTADRAEAMLAACKEVGPALFFSLLIITVSFLPVFSLEGQEGRLFSPLAYTKTFAMAGAALLSVTLVPVLMLLFIRGKILPEAKNPVNRFLIWVYRPIIAGVMRWKKLTIVLAVLALALRSIRPPGSAPSSCRRSTRARCSTCRPRCRGCRSPRRPS